MNRPTAGLLSVVMCCVVGLVVWYLYSMFQFYYGWIRLDPLCLTDGRFRYPVLVIENLYTPDAATRLRDVIASEFSDEAVYLDDDGAVYIRPMLYYGRLFDLDRFGQLVVRPEDKTYLYQTPGVTCEELQPFVRSKIDLSEASILGMPFSLYVFVLQPDDPTLNMWELWYMPREKIFRSS